MLSLFGSSCQAEQIILFNNPPVIQAARGDDYGHSLTYLHVGNIKMVGNLLTFDNYGYCGGMAYCHRDGISSWAGGNISVTTNQGRSIVVFNVNVSNNVIGEKRVYFTGTCSLILNNGEMITGFSIYSEFRNSYVWIGESNSVAVTIL